MHNMNEPRRFRSHRAALEAMNTSNCHPPPIVLQKTTVLHKPMRKPTTQNKPPPPAIISFSSDEWNKDLAPAAPAEKHPEAITLERDAVDERIPLEARGLPEWEGSHSLIDALVAHGLPGLEVSDARRLAHVCKVLKRDMEDDEVWRLQCAMLAKEHDLYAPASSCNWRQVRASKQRSQSTAQPPSQPSLNSSLHMFARASQLFLETLWPARGKWKGGADGVASESKGFRIRVAACGHEHDGS